MSTSILTSQSTGRKVHHVRNLTENTYVLRFDRLGMRFSAGQYVSVGSHESGEQREYSIYSGEKDDYMEILVKEIQKGKVSRTLKKLQANDNLDVHGPFGFFSLPEDWAQQKFLFVSTGTGISPFRSFVRTHDNLDYSLIHGVRWAEEAYDKNEFKDERFTLCLSRGQGGDYQGRVTEYLRAQSIDPGIQAYLCGNCEMIYEVYDVLKSKGVSPANIHTEVYF